MTLHRVILILGASGLALAGGCRRSPTEPPEPQAGAATTVTNEQPAVSLEVAADRESMSTTDRLTLTIRVTRPAGLPLTLTEPDWSSADWTLIDTIDTPPIPDPGGTISRSRTLTLEPFLEGDYAVPPVTVAWHDPAPGVLASQPLTVTVRSVLPAEDSGDLAGPAGFAPPPAAVPAPRWPFTVLGACGLTALLIAWRWSRTRRPGPSPPDTPAEALSRLARTDHPDLGGLHAAIDALVAAGRLPTDLLARCERLRFGPHAGADAPSQLARDAHNALLPVQEATA